MRSNLLLAVSLVFLPALCMAQVSSDPGVEMTVVDAYGLVQDSGEVRIVVDVSLSNLDLAESSFSTPIYVVACQDGTGFVPFNGVEPVAEYPLEIVDQQPVFPCQCGAASGQCIGDCPPRLGAYEVVYGTCEGPFPCTGDSPCECRYSGIIVTATGSVGTDASGYCIIYDSSPLSPSFMDGKACAAVDLMPMYSADDEVDDLDLTPTCPVGGTPATERFDVQASPYNPEELDAERRSPGGSQGRRGPARNRQIPDRHRR